jgi:hypothetical protein
MNILPTKVAELFWAFSDTGWVTTLSALLSGEKNVSTRAALVGIIESAMQSAGRCFPRLGTSKR